MHDLKSNILPIRPDKLMFKGFLKEDMRVVRVERTVRNVTQINYADLTDNEVRKRVKRLQIAGFPKGKV